MSTQNKYPTGGKVAKNVGKSITKVPNTYSAPRALGAQKVTNNQGAGTVSNRWNPGQTMGAENKSSHNNINAFTRGIKSRGPYGGPTFNSLNNYERAAKSSNTTVISKFPTPSGGGTGAVVNSKTVSPDNYNNPLKSNRMGSAGSDRTASTVRGGSGYSVSGPKTRVGSGSAKATQQMAKAPAGNKKGSGHQAGLGRARK